MKVKIELLTVSVRGERGQIIYAIVADNALHLHMVSGKGILGTVAAKGILGMVWLRRLLGKDDLRSGEMKLAKLSQIAFELGVSLIARREASEKFN